MQNEWWILTLLGVMCSNLESVLAAWEQTCTPLNRRIGPDPGGICGRRIDETLSVLCMGNYNEHPYDYRKKRDTQHINDRPWKLKQRLLDRATAHSYLVKRSDYITRGIVCECCYHRCSIRELFQYCSDSGPSFFGLFKRSLPDRLKPPSQD